MIELHPIRWFEADPGRLSAELARVAEVAPDLVWTDTLDHTTGGGWRGQCPVWPFARERPPNLDDFLEGRRFSIEVRCSAAHPVAAPAVIPLDPVPDIHVRTAQEWHVMGDGSLCLLQHALDWTGRETVEQLVVKAAGWYLEFLLLSEGLIERMTIKGIAEDGTLDHLFTKPARVKGPGNGNG
jgi:hypothetical protein